MTWFYLRWGGVGITAIILVVLTYQHYQQHLVSVTPEFVITQAPTDSALRVQGMVKSGSLKGKVQEGHAEFELVGESSTMSVAYDGPPPDNLRELKTLIIVGKWDGTAETFRARDTAIVTNFGFVTSAYLIGTLPLVIFVFVMGRRVTFLFQEIKQSKLYESEADLHVDQR